MAHSFLARHLLFCLLKIIFAGAKGTEEPLSPQGARSITIKYGLCPSEKGEIIILILITIIIIKKT